MVEKMHIKVQFSEDTLFYRWDESDLAQYDVKASMDRYAEHLVNYLYANYPDAYIEVVQGMDRITVDDQTDHAEVDAVQDIIGKVHNDADWEVER